MDSVDGCCGPRKPDGFQNAQAGSNPKKVDLIIWEIEVPKVRAAGLKCPQAWGHQACWGGGSEEGTGNPEAAPSGSQRLEGRECSTLPRSREPPCRRQFLQLPSGESFSKPQPDSPPLGLFFFFFFLWCSDLFGDAGKTWLRIGAGQAFPHCSAHAHQHRVCLIIEHSINPCGRELEKYSDV